MAGALPSAYQPVSSGPNSQYMGSITSWREVWREATLQEVWEEGGSTIWQVTISAATYLRGGGWRAT